VSESTSNQAVNPEAQRLLLLQAMGIRSYYPRFQLPGALPSVACAWMEDTAAPEVVTPAMPVKAPVAIVARESIQPEPVAPVTRTEPVRARPAGPMRQREEQQVANAGTLSFQVLLLQADKGLAICNQLPAVAGPGLARGEQQLLNNMLQWLGCSLQPGKVQRHFSWPLPGMAVTDANQAGLGLLSFLAQAQQDSGFTRLLLLGHSSVDCLQPRLANSDFPWQTWCTHSLSELLASPSLKRSAWQQLQTLHAALR